jgi:hypothetical protein
MSLPSTNRYSRALVASLAVSCLCDAGCSSKQSIAPVAGTITVDGSPLADATITTQPISTHSRNPGSGSFGHTDAQGHFALELVKPPIQGAIIAEHRVMITPGGRGATTAIVKRSADGAESWSDDPRGNLAVTDKKWPAHFTDGSLRLVVPPEGNTDVHLDLKR